MLLTISIALFLVAGDSTPTCLQDLEGLNRTVQADYAGFRLEITGTRREVFDRMLDSVRTRAAGASGDACLSVLQSYTDFFDDPHLFIYQSTRVDSAESARRAAQAERLPGGVESAQAYLRSHADHLDAIEGVWRASGLRIAVVREPSRGPRAFVAVVLDGDTSTWTPGTVRGRFVKTGDDQYDGELFERNFARRLVRPAIYKRVLLRFDPGMWGKESPVLAADSGLVDPVDPHRATLVIRSGVPILSIPSHDPSYRPFLDSLLTRNRDVLTRADRLVIDLRGNEGGSSGTTAGVLPYLVTDSQRPSYFKDRSAYPDHGKGVMLSSPDQIAYAIGSIMGGDTSDPSAKRFLDRLRAHPGGFATFADSLDPPSTPAARISPIYGPRAVGILVDHGTVSAGEAFLIQAMRSMRVTTFGQATAGALDYQTVRIVRFLPDESRWRVGYPTITAHPDLPANGIRGKGIRPDRPVDFARERDPIRRVITQLRDTR